MSAFIFNEPMPDCVPEFYRSQQEEADRLYEQYLYDQARYEMNRAKLDDASASGLPILLYAGYSQCRNCKDADTDTETDEEDDFCRVICHNPDCPCHKEEEEAERAANPHNMIVSWIAGEEEELEQLRSQYEAGEISEADYLDKKSDCEFNIWDYNARLERMDAEEWEADTL